MRRFPSRFAPTGLVALALCLAATACDADSDDAAYLGTWDPVMLTPQGEVTVIANGGISFREDQVCFVRFSEECYDASYAPLGDTIAVNMNADPTYYLLHTPFDGYLVVREMSDRPILYIRREE
ncbi:MAG: hypothetical protein AAF563_24515 [Pseudomonadota bacterium]